MRGSQGGVREADRGTSSETAERTPPIRGAPCRVPTRAAARSRTAAARTLVKALRPPAVWFACAFLLLGDLGKWQNDFRFGQGDGVELISSWWTAASR